MRYSINDVLVDTIAIAPAKRSSKSYPPVIVSADDELCAIKNVLKSVAWGHLDMCAKGSADGTEFGNDGGEFLFDSSSNLEPEVEPFEGVLFADSGGNEAVVSRPAFRRLMDRFFSVLIDIANERHLDVRNDPRWPVFLEHAQRMKALVRQAT